ncbi:MAG: NADPH-dependent glutamate synthase [Endomicrobium sp.]|jgi:glutamate synthase (NADPH/NADH) small chain|nr:NADPH-dependent glutamate synthase [Endomicrobium sp.]
MSQTTLIHERTVQERIHDFKEVSYGYDHNDMIQEAKRCLQCTNPLCRRGCPVEVNIPEFIKYIAENNPYKAVAVIKKKNNFPAVCGRVCAQENQCEKFCILSKKNKSICIGNLERYVADITMNNSLNLINKNGQYAKIAIIGSGPAGLSCASDLLQVGHKVIIYESLHDAGGVLRYGVPEFRLPKKILDMEINNLKQFGLTIILNNLIGRTKTINNLFHEQYKAIFIGTGSGLPIFPGIEGENLKHIYCANEFLVRVNLMNAYDFPDKADTPVYVGKNVVIVGGGNTAMDSARTAIRLGAKNVKIIYRRTEHEMPSRRKEKVHAKEEGVEFITLTTPIRFISDDNGAVNGVECVKVESIYNKGEKSIKYIINSKHIIKTDMVVLALGLRPNCILPSLTKNLHIDQSGYIKIDHNYMTSINGVFAGGDIVGGSTVIEAMGMGKKAAQAIINFIKNTK